VNILYYIILEIGMESTRSHCVENSIWRRLWTYSKTDYGKNELINEYYIYIIFLTRYSKFGNKSKVFIFCKRPPIYVCMYVCVYICFIYMCIIYIVCVCVCVCVGG
jgi:hypothetical protein